MELLSETEAAALVRRDGSQFQYLSQKMRANVHVALNAIFNYPQAYKYISYGLSLDYKLLIETLKRDGMMYEFAHPKFKADVYLLRVAMCHSRGEAIKFAPKCIRELDEFRNQINYDNYDEVMAMVMEDGVKINRASIRLKDTEEIAMAAVRQNLHAYEYISERLKRSDVNIALHVVSIKPEYYINLHNNMKCNRNIMLKVASLNGILLKTFPPEFHGDREITLEAIRQDGNAYRYSSIEDDYELIKVALHTTPSAISFMIDDVRDNEEIMLDVLERNLELYVYFSDRLKQKYGYNI